MGIGQPKFSTSVLKIMRNK